MLLISFINQCQYNAFMIQQKVKTTGIVRNRMTELLRLKGRKKVPIKRFSKASLRKAIDEDDYIKSSLLTDTTKTSEIQMTLTDEPSWVVNYKECVGLLRQVENLQGEISKEKMKKMSSICEEKHDQIIQKFVEEATTKLNKCEKRLKQMQIQAPFQQDSTATNRKAFTSMLMSMACNIRQQARRLRAQQQSQLHRQRQLSSYNRDILKGAARESGEVEQWLSEEDFEVLEQSFIKERDQEITKVVQSIYSLNAIYKELQNLVIEQGSLLDRIDENIDRTVQSVKEANKHLEEANKKSESACFSKMRLMLIIAIGVLFVIFILKHS